jgi:DNA-binding protein HU-beta
MAQEISKGRAPRKSARRRVKSPAKAGSIKTREIERAVKKVARQRTEATKSGSARLNYFAQKTGSNRAQITELFEELASLAALEVKTKGEFVLPGFGKLVRSERKAREGRNPATGEVIQIPAKTMLKFQIGKTMKDSALPKK